MKTLKILCLALALVVFILPAAAQDEAQTPQEICEAAAPAADPATREFSTAEAVIEAGVDYRAIICTGAGPVYVDLFEKYAPMTVNNFVFLAQQGYYNNSIFHRVIPDFMAQGGDPVGNPAGTGGPGYQFDDEPVPFIVFDRPGLLAMANAGSDPSTGSGTNGSQFFITTTITDWLTYKHTIFGDVLSGYESVQAIQLCDPDCTGVTPTTLDTVVIITDPAGVEADIAPDPAATADDFLAALDLIKAAESIPDDIAVMEDISVASTTEDVVESAGADAAEALTAFLEEHNHEFRARLGLTNANCNPQYPFSTLVYTVDALGSGDDVTAALADERLDAINEAEGFTRTESAIPLYTKTVPDCSGAEVTMGKAYIQRGRFLVAMEAVLAPNTVPDADLAAFLSGSATSIFEQFMAAPLRSAVR